MANKKVDSISQALLTTWPFVHPEKVKASQEDAFEDGFEVAFEDGFDALVRVLLF